MGINKITVILCTLILSIGIIGGGYSIGKGIYLIKKMSRTVTVKGISEMDVKSDLGIWEINYREVGNDLIKLDQQLMHNQQLVIEFLKQQGFTDQEIDRSQFKIEDRFANIYAQNNEKNANQPRYIVTGGVRVRSEKVGLIEKTVRLADTLIQQGVPLAFDYGMVSPNPSYYYMQLDKIRAPMMSDATKSAQVVAEQFAKDSNNTLGGVQRASQGVFQIMGRDTSTMSSDWNSNQSALGSIDKKVRLVTTIDYRLK
ncbi:MAG: hypothetical protein ACD_46C00695G0002 [uncultured bacterium]|nr:MAG: hypothetical protein ACD_46C00695G0002 [uncultured bacterium]